MRESVNNRSGALVWFHLQAYTSELAADLDCVAGTGPDDSQESNGALTMHVAQDSEGRNVVSFYEQGNVVATFVFSSPKGFLGAAVNQLGLCSTILDGEIVALDAEGIPRFQLLQHSKAFRRGPR